MKATLLATVAALSLGTAALAQPVTTTQPATGQPTAAATARPAMLQNAERTLRQAVQNLGTGGANAVAAVRDALTNVQTAFQGIPADQRSGAPYRELERELTDAIRFAEGDRADPTRLRAEAEQVLNALGAIGTAGPMTAGTTAGTGGAAGGTIVVQQPAASIQVEQPQPRIVVTQGEPVVTVIVPQPEIIVRQPPPQVRVQLPRPDVMVEQAQPQVRVTEAQPQVQVAPTQQPQVAYQQAEPRVVVEQQGQPQVRVEQQGQAQVQIERMGEGQVAMMQTGRAPGVTTERQATDRQATAVTAGTTTGTTAGTTTGTAAGGVAQPAPATGGGVALANVQRLVGTNVVGANNRDAGSIENLLVDRSGQVRAAIIEWGGFLGIGERRAVVPIDQIRFEGDRARLSMTREQLEALPRYERGGNITEYGTRYGWGEGVRLYR
jgi:hypothetical protein